MEITISHEPLSLEVVFQHNDDSWRTLKGVKFSACGDDSGESFVLGLIRQSRKVGTRKMALKVNGRILMLSLPNKYPLSFVLPEGVSSRELKLLFRGHGQYRNMKMTATMSWAKELSFINA